MDSNFFTKIENGIKPGDVVEFYGDEGTGKTQVLLHLIANCILPKYWKCCKLDGRNAKVAFIDTEYKFPLWRLVSILENRIHEYKKDFSVQKDPEKVTDYELKQTKSCIGSGTEKPSIPLRDNELNYYIRDQDQSSLQELNDFVKLCLSNLYILKCSTSSELAVTLNALDSLLHANSDLCVLMIDSISAFYWLDRTMGGESRRQQETSQRAIVRALQKLKENYHVVTIATKSCIFEAKKQRSHEDDESTSDSKRLRRYDTSGFHQEFMSSDWQKFIKYRYVFQKHRTENGDYLYSATLINPLREGLVKFRIKESGIQFL